jgi:hypothetical protein
MHSAIIHRDDVVAPERRNQAVRAGHQNRPSASQPP